MVNGDKWLRLLDSPLEAMQDLKTTPTDPFTGYERQDDLSAVALFYLDSPENRLPALARWPREFRACWPKTESDPIRGSHGPNANKGTLSAPPKTQCLCLTGVRQSRRHEAAETAAERARAHGRPSAPPRNPEAAPRYPVPVRWPQSAAIGIGGR